MTKVMHVFGTMNLGGAEMRTVELFRELAPQGFIFHFIALTGERGALDDELRSMGGVVHPVRLGLRFPWRFLRLLRTERPDVLDSHVATFSGILLLAACVAGVPHRIAHFRSDGDGHPDSLPRRAQRLFMIGLIRLFATDIVGVSPSALDCGYRSNWRTDKRAQVIVNGFRPFTAQPAPNELRSTLALGPESVLMLHVGRPTTEKNRVQTVRILSALRDNGIDVHLALVGGPGQDSQDLTAESVRLGVRRYVSELGSRRDVRCLMSGADILLLTSAREGLPGVVLEALSTGTPVVASDLPGVSFISERISGIRMVNVDDPPDSWARAVEASMTEGRSGAFRERIRRDFDCSGFSIVDSARRHRLLYLGLGL